MCDEFTTNSTVLSYSVAKAKGFPLKLEIRKAFLLLILFFNIVLKPNI